MHAPVRVAISTMASGFNSVANDNPSAKIKRPSASVFKISEVFPLRKVNTSPIATALPDGRLSVHIKYPVTAVRQRNAFNVLMADNTAAAPDMSIFIMPCMPSLGFKLIPPES